MTNMVVFKTTPALLCKLTFIFGMHATGFKQIHSYFTPKIKKETIKVMFNHSNVVFTEPTKKKTQPGLHYITIPKILPKLFGNSQVRNS